MKIFVIRVVLSAIIIYFFIYAGIVLKNIWFKEPDIRKTFPNPFGFIHFKKPVYLPELKFSLQQIPSNFATGIQVDGLTWEKDFYQYFLKIRNKKTEIYDIRIDVDFLGGVINKEIRLQQGCDSINFSADGFFNTGIGKKGQINKTFPVYSNNLKISASRIYQDGYFEIKLTIKDLPMTKNGLFEVSYRYLDENGEQKKWANRYKILRYNNGAMYIDSENPFKDAVKRSMRMIPVKPLVFKKDGTITEKESKDEPKQ